MALTSDQQEAADRLAKGGPLREQAIDLGSRRSGGKKSSLLPSSPPNGGATREELAAWATVALAMGEDPIVEVTRYGRQEDARMVVWTRSGRRIVFDQQGQAFDAAAFRRRVVIATSVTIAHYESADVQAIATVLVRMADIRVDTDDRHETFDWADSFVVGASEHHIMDVGTFDTPAGKFEALSILRGLKPGEDISRDAPPAERSVIVREEGGRRWVRASDVAAHVRSIVPKAITWAAIQSRLVEVGWQYLGEVQQWHPEDRKVGKVKVHVYEIPADWEDR